MYVLRENSSSKNIQKTGVRIDLFSTVVISLSGSSTPRQIPRDNIISSLHNSINDLSYSVEPVQKKSTVESYRAIKVGCFLVIFTNF